MWPRVALTDRELASQIKTSPPIDSHVSTSTLPLSQPFTKGVIYVATKL